jgi:hypothetical protein
MTINSQFGRTAFTFRPDKYLEGQPCEGLEIIARPVPNPYRREIWTLTAGGTAADGDYNAVIREGGADGRILLEHAFERADSETSAQVAAAWAASFLDLAAIKGLILSAEVTSASIAVRFKHAGRSYHITGTAESTATFAAVETLSWEGVGLPVGTFVVHATLEGLASVGAPGNSAAKTDMAGVVLRPHAGLARPMGLEDSIPEHKAGRAVAPATQCIFAARNRGSVASAAGGQVFVVRNTAGGQGRGQVRADADSTNTVALDLVQARWLDVTQPGELGPLQVTL